MERRKFLGLATGTLALTTLPSCASRLAADRQTTVKTTSIPIDAKSQAPWLGPHFWANRLQDWRTKDGKICCVENKTDNPLRTAHILTHRLSAQPGAARLRTKVQILDGARTGFAGFLIGAGTGLDYRSASLIQYAASENGGLLAVIEADGQLSIRDLSDPNRPLSYDRYGLDEENQARGLDAFSLGQRSVALDCYIDPLPNNTYDLRLILSDAQTNQELGFIVKTGVTGDLLSGNVALVSSPGLNSDPEPTGTRFAFEGIEVGGEKLEHYEERALGPVLGCLHSVNRSVMKLTAQFMPIDKSLYPLAKLEVRKQGETTWRSRQTAEIGAGYAALFRLDDWDSTAHQDYRIVFPDAPDTPLYSGTIQQDPDRDRPLKIALHSCLLPTSRPIDRPQFKNTSQLEENFGRWSEKSLIFPHIDLTKNCDSHDPDLYVFLGDQYYEVYPTRYGRDTEYRELDTLYRWYLWLWTFRDSLRSKPCILLADDHDVLQGNIWGNGGASLGPREEDGGFKHDKELVRMVYRIQCGHNPDNYDPTPILHDIPVSYGHFVYGGTSFAFVEDRKWKTPPSVNEGVPLQETTGALLGERQEAFLKDWANLDSGLPKICLTASIWGSPQTSAELEPLIDYDANGYPPDGRTRAVSLLRDANAMALAGDQHLGMVARQGVSDFEDGPLFFAGPAGAAFWQRWFEGQGRLSNQYQNNPDSGNFTDSFGNLMRILAVANPKVTHADFLNSKEGWGYFVGDRALKSEGYGLIQVDHTNEAVHLECWPWDAVPTQDKQFDGWPIQVKFDELGESNKS